MKFISRAASLGFLAVLFYYPLAVIFAKGWSLDFLFAEDTFSIIWFTIWQALVSALGATFIGLLFAYLLYRKRFFGQQVVRALFTVPFVMPVLVIAIAVSTFQISNVLVAILLAHIYINAPLVARAVGSAWLELDSEVEDAAELDGAGRFATFIRVTVFQLRTSIVSSFVLAFAYCSAAFTTVLLMGNGLVNSIETAIYQKVFSYLDLPAATALAAVQLLLTVILFALSNRLVKGDFGFGNSVGSSLKRLDLRDLPAVLIGAALLLAWAWPIWNVFQIAISINANIGMTPQLLAALANSFRNVLVVLVLCATFGTFVGYQLRYAKGWFKSLLGFAYLAPISVSTVLVGLGYLVGFSSFRSSWLVIPLAETVLALPLVVRLVAGALNSIDVAQLEQAQVDGSTRFQLFRFVELPQISSSLKAALGFAAIIALGDFGASAFLSYGDQDTLPILLFRLFGKPGADNYSQAIALTALFMLLTVVAVLLTSVRISKRSEPTYR